MGVLVYGLLALFIALPLGALLAFGMTKFLLNLFNIDYDSSTSRPAPVPISWWRQLSCRSWPRSGLFWAALPLPCARHWQATAWGAISAAIRLDRGVKSLGAFCPGPYAIALGDLFRRKGRLLLTQSVLILAGTMFLAVMSLSSSLNLTVDNIFTKRQFDILMAFDDDQRLERTVAVAQQHSGVREAELVFRHRAL